MNSLFLLAGLAMILVVIMAFIATDGVFLAP